MLPPGSSASAALWREDGRPVVSRIACCAAPAASGCSPGRPPRRPGRPEPARRPCAGRHSRRPPARTDAGRGSTPDADPIAGHPGPPPGGPGSAHPVAPARRGHHPSTRPAPSWPVGSCTGAKRMPGLQSAVTEAARWKSAGSTSRIRGRWSSGGFACVGGSGRRQTWTSRFEPPRLRPGLLPGVGAAARRKSAASTSRASGSGRPVGPDAFARVVPPVGAPDREVGGSDFLCGRWLLWVSVARRLASRSGRLPTRAIARVWAWVPGSRRRPLRLPVRAPSCARPRARPRCRAQEVGAADFLRGGQAAWPRQRR